MTDYEFQQLIALCDKATPGPWDTGYDDGDIVVRANCTVVAVIGDEMDQTEHDAAFIAASRSAVPSLVAEVRKLQSEVERLKSVAAYYEVQF